MSDEEQVFLAFIRQKKDNILLKGHRISLPNEFTYIRNKVWELAFSGEIKAYKDDSLKSFYNLKELKVHSSLEKYKFSTHLYYTIDSTNVPIYPIDSFNRLIFLYEWEMGDGFALKANLKAVAPALQGYYGNKDLFLEQGALFWAKWEDISPYFTKEELAFYRYLFLFTLKKSVGKTNYKFIRLWDKE